MTHSRNLLGLMGKRPIDESPLKPRENLTGIPLHEHRLGDGAGRPAKKDNAMPNMLIESIPSLLTLTESVGADGKKKTIARGEFGRVGVATANGRIYTEKLMQREFDRLAEAVSNRQVLGTLDHPENGKTSLKNVSHVILGQKIKDGIIVGEAEILDTPEGKILKSLIESQVKIGISSRGFGSTRTSNDPKMVGEVVQDDFVLKTWDFVADPAVKTAIPGMFTEDVDGEQPDISQMFLDEFPEIASTLQEDAIAKAKLKVNKGVDEAVKEAEERVRADMSESFEKRFASSIVEVKEDIASELREEFESDPEIGGSKAMLSAIWEMVAPFRAADDEKAVSDASKARDLEVAEASESAEKSEERAISAECMEYIEREIGGHPMAESIRKLMSKHKFDGLEDAKEKLAAILKDLPERTDEGMVSEEDAELREQNAAMREKLSLLTERVESLDAKLRKAVEVGMEADAQREDAEGRVQEAEKERDEALEESTSAEAKLQIEVYKHDKVVGLANGRQLLSLMEGMTSEAVVDRLVTEKGSRDVSEQRLVDARKSLQRGTGEQQEKGSLNEEKGKKPSGRATDDLGNDMDFMRRLSGLE